MGFGLGGAGRWEAGGLGVFSSIKQQKASGNHFVTKNEREPKLSITFINVLIRNCLHKYILRMSQLYKQIMHFEGVCFYSSGALKVLPKELTSFPVEMI